MDEQDDLAEPIDDGSTWDYRDGNSSFDDEADGIGEANGIMRCVGWFRATEEIQFIG